MASNLPYHADRPELTSDDPPLPRVVGIRIEPEMMTELLRLPPGVRVCRIRMAGDELECVLTGVDFAGLPSGCLLPEVSALYRQRPAMEGEKIVEFAELRFYPAP